MSKVDTTDTIPIITVQVEESGEARTMFPSTTKMVIKSTQIATKTLSENLLDFIRMLNVVVEKLPESCGRYAVDELTFSLSVDGSGKISLIGELSAGVTSGITIKLKKNRER